MTRPALTAQALRHAAPEERPFELRSRRVPNLLVRVQPTGIRTFYVQIGRGKRLRLADARVVTLEEAEALARKAVLNPVEFQRARVAGQTLGTFVKDTWSPWVKANRRTGSVTAHRMEERFAHLYDKPMSDLNVPELERYRTKRLQGGIKPATVNREVTVLYSCLSRAVEWGVLTVHPLARLQPLQVAGGRLRFLADHELDALRRTFGADRMPRYLRPLVLLAVNTGMRMGECLHLRWKHVDLTANVVTVEGTYAKNAKTRHIPLNKEASDALVDWFHVRNKEADLVFPGAIKGAVQKNVDVPLRRLFRLAGIEGASFHTLRHTFASRLVQKGVDPRAVQELMGHGDLRMTTKYLHLAPGRLAAAVAVL